MALVPVSESSAATAAAPSPLMSDTTTPAAPWAAKARHRARPMPEAPPVTTTIRPWMFTGCLYCRCSGPERSVPSDLGHSVGVFLHVGVLGEEVGVLLHGLLPLGREVLGVPQALMGPVVLEHVAGHGDLMDLIDPVHDAHGGRARPHRLQRGEVGDPEGAED